MHNAQRSSPSAKTDALELLENERLLEEPLEILVTDAV